MEIKTQCTKCGGKGIINAFRHICGGECFSCQGKGYVMISKKTLNARKRRAAKAAKLQAQREALALAERQQMEDNVDRYINDPRIGPETKESLIKRGESGSATERAIELVQMLLNWDKDPASFPAYLKRNLAY